METDNQVTGYFIQVDSQNGSQRTPLVKQSNIIGRPIPESIPEISINDIRVSRQHAILEYKNGSFYIRKMRGSSLLVNEVEINGESPLSESDIVNICDHKIRIVKIRQKKAIPATLLTLLLLATAISFYIATMPEKGKANAIPESKTGTDSALVDIKCAAELENDRKAFPENFDKAISVYSEICSSNLSDTILSLAKSKIDILIAERDSIVEEIISACHILVRCNRKSEASRLAAEGLRYVTDPNSKTRIELLRLSENNQ